MKRLFSLLIAGSLLLAAIAPAAAQQEATTGLKPIIIDTDMAVDDWMGILYLLQRKDVNVLAVTIAGTGEAHCNPGIQNTMNLVALAGNPDVPVACGRETPRKGSNTFPQQWRDAVDRMNGLTLPKNPNAPGSLNAVDLLRQQINQSAEKVTVVTLGPLTNIAELVQADPAAVNRIQTVYVMGGAVGVPGNLPGTIKTDNTTAEWNIYVDPLAAAQVFESGLPVTLVPLDATNHAPLTMAFYQKLDSLRTTPEAEFVYGAVSSQIGFAESGGWYFWDPMAAVTASDESVVTIEDRKVRVITEEGQEFGRTALDGEGNSVRVAVDADVNRFEQIFLNVLNGRDPLAALPAMTVKEPESAEPITTPIEGAADMFGIWRWQTVPFHFQFRSDGTYRANEAFTGLTSDSPEDLGTYEVRAGTLTLTSGKTSRFCRAGDVGVYQIYLAATGQLALVLQKDACSMREAPSAKPQLFDPVGADGTSLAFPTGTYVGEPYLMTLNSDGTYVFGTLDGQIISKGIYTIKADTFRWVKGTYCDTPATYTWKFEKGALTFMPIGQDACADRQASLALSYARQ